MLWFTKKKDKIELSKQSFFYSCKIQFGMSFEPKQKSDFFLSSLPVPASLGGTHSPAGHRPAPTRPKATGPTGAHTPRTDGGRRTAAAARRHGTRAPHMP